MRAAAASLGVTIALMSCGHGNDRPEPAPDPAPADRTEPAPARDDVPPAERPAVVLATGSGDEVRVEVEVVRTPRERNRGLMYRQHLPPDNGMLFIFETEEIQRFWMKNTLIPLDMIFIRRDLTVAGIVESAEPRTTTSRFVDEPSTYVLEVNGGWSRAHGIAPNAAVRFENIEL